MGNSIDFPQHPVISGTALLVAAAVAGMVYRGRKAPAHTSIARSKNTHRSEARITKAKNYLLVLSENDAITKDTLMRDFCGTVITALTDLPDFSNATVYLCGDISNTKGINLDMALRVFIVRDVSFYYEEFKWPVVSTGQVPIIVHGVGVYYRRFFPAGSDHFNKIRNEHGFQTLSESDKPGVALRTGIYLSPVRQEGNDTHFNLLRCSSNFSGPTENFGATDRHIIDSLNEEASFVFDKHAPLNHVLAQIYHNSKSSQSDKETKAKIKAHSDKTKDMPSTGIMAFCTFYDHLDRLKPHEANPFDYAYKGRGASGLTTLKFQLKKCVADRQGCTLKHTFEVTLYPDSVFLMSLETNRLYTHEIKASPLNIDHLPTRMGYVVRCSNSEAVHRDGHTFLIAQNNDRIKLEPPTRDDMAHLRELYALENMFDDFVEYGQILFSMNRGDYERPIC